MGVTQKLRSMLRRKQKEIPGKVRCFDADGWEVVEYTGAVSMDSYEVLGVLGRGATSTVYAARERDGGRTVALKVMEKGRMLGMLKKVGLEKEVMAALRDVPQVLRVLNTYQTEEHAVFTMELMTGGDLFSYITRHPESRLDPALAQYYCKQLALGLSAVHARGIIYRDLKCENVLLAGDGSLRIADFGLSRFFPETEERCHSFVGTAHYIAPEVIKGGGYGYEADYWCLGVVAYNMVTGMNPFSGDSFDRVFRNIVRGSFVFPEEVAQTLPELCKDFICQLLTTSPSDRLTGPAVLSHPWMVAAPDVPPPLAVPVAAEYESGSPVGGSLSTTGRKLSRKQQELFADFDSSFESSSDGCSVHGYSSA